LRHFPSPSIIEKLFDCSLPRLFKKTELKIYLAKTETATAIKLSSIKFRFIFLALLCWDIIVVAVAINVMLFSESTKQVIKLNGKISSLRITNGDVHGVVEVQGCVIKTELQDQNEVLEQMKLE
jgi:hypothetical protein